MPLLTIKQTTVLLGMLCVMVMNSAIAAPKTVAPKKVTLEYELKRDGQLFAKMTEHFTQDGEQYAIESVTKGIGIYALLGKRELKSHGVVTKRGLKPLHFESLQSKRPNKALINDFNWETNTLKMQIKGEKQDQVLQSNTQDLLSIMYQFMFNPPMKSTFATPLTTGKKLYVTDYQVATKTKKQNTQAGNFNVVTLTEKDSDEPKMIYLAKDHHYLPIKIVSYDDGAKFEQSLTKMTFE